MKAAYRLHEVSLEEAWKKMIYQPKSGNRCSRNFKFLRPITSFEEFNNCLKTCKSMFIWNRLRPCAFVENFSFRVIRYQINNNGAWICERMEDK
jgi:hypothetical protein